MKKPRFNKDEQFNLKGLAELVERKRLEATQPVTVNTPPNLEEEKVS